MPLSVHARSSVQLSAGAWYAGGCPSACRVHALCFWLSQEAFVSQCIIGEGDCPRLDVTGRPQPAGVGCLQCCAGKGGEAALVVVSAGPGWWGSLPFAWEGEAVASVLCVLDNFLPAQVRKPAVCCRPGWPLLKPLPPLLVTPSPSSWLLMYWLLDRDWKEGLIHFC